MSSAVPPVDVERVSEEDQAARASELFLDAALRRQQRAACKRASEPGVCTNCGSACLPQAVYCDQACREDHEHRLALEQRQGRR